MIGQRGRSKVRGEKIYICQNLLLCSLEEVIPDFVFRFLSMKWVQSHASDLLAFGHFEGQLERTLNSVLLQG